MGLDDIYYRAEFLAIDSLNGVRKAKKEYEKHKEKAIYLRSKLEGTGINYSRERIQMTPDNDPMADVIEQLIEEEKNLVYWSNEFNLRFMILETDCERAGFSAEQTEAVLLYYSDLNTSYESVASKLNLSKEKVRYYVKGKGCGKYTIEFKIAQVYLEIIRSIGGD